MSLKTIEVRNTEYRVEKEIEDIWMTSNESKDLKRKVKAQKFNLIDNTYDVLVASIHYVDHSDVHELKDLDDVIDHPDINYSGFRLTTYKGHHTRELMLTELQAVQKFIERFTEVIDVKDEEESND